MPDTTLSPTVEVNLLTATLQDIVSALDNGQTTTAALVNAYLERIDKDDPAGAGQELKSISEVAPRDTLMSTAAKLDEERKSGKKRSILHGVPIVIKDTIDTSPALGMHTTGGTWALMGNMPKENATVVDTLLENGLIIIGKANLTVMNNLYTDDISSAWSPRNGLVKSAFGPTLDPTGSSVGSAVALSAGFCATALGTESWGSIIAPSLNAGVFGLKPTIGLVDRKGVIPSSSTYDSVGPMGKSSWDIAAMMDVIAPTESLPDQPQQSWMRFLTGAQSIHGESLRRLRIGVYAAPYEEGHGEERDNVVQQMTGPLSQLADEVNLVDHFEIPGVAKMNLEPLTVILPTDFYNEFKRYLEGVTGPIDSLEALNAWNSANPTLAFPKGHDPARHPNYLELSASGRGQHTQSYLDAQATFQSWGRCIKDAMNTHHLDALMVCEASQTWVMSAAGEFAACTAPCTIKADGAPTGPVFFARAGDDGILLRIMSICEKVYPPRAVPSAMMRV